MVSLGNEEQAAVEGLLACLALALQRSQRYSISDLNQTKVQKFVFLGAKEFDLDITYSWYLAGSYAAGATDGFSAVDTAFNDFSKPPSPEIAEADEPELSDERDPDDEREATDEPIFRENVMPDISREFEVEQGYDDQFSTSESMTDETSLSDEMDRSSFEDANAQMLPEEFATPVEDVVDFYGRILRQYPLHPTDRFLQQFYEYHAPAEYASIYEHCLRLRDILRTIEDDITTAVSGQTQEVDLEHRREKFGRELSELHMELYEVETIRATAETVIAGTEPIEEAIISLAAMSPETLSDTHREAIEMLQDYFYYVVWKYPALRISIDTATGPSADAIIIEHREKYQAFDQTVETRRENILQHLETAGLRPDLTDHTDHDDSTAQKFGDMMSIFQNRSG